MSEQKPPIVSIKRKLKIFVNPKYADKLVLPLKPAKPSKAKALEQIKVPKLKQLPPKPLSREQRMARNREKKLRRGQKAMVSLIAHWPQLFNIEQPRPLKIGIAKEIYKDIKTRELNFTRAKACAALMFYTQTPAYQQAIYAGGRRFDFYELTSGEITEQQQAHALKQLEKWRAEADAATSLTAEPT